MIIKIEGQEFEVLGSGRCTTPGQRDTTTHFINGPGELITIDPNRHQNSAEYCLYLRKIPVTHKFGGVVFEETGEHRIVQAGEWFGEQLNTAQGRAAYCWFETRLDFTILRPVAVED